MSRKKLFSLFAGLLVTAGVIASQFPGAGPAVGTGLRAAGQGLQQIGSSMLEDCSVEQCGGGAVHGVWHPDGGTCRCP